MKKNDDQCLSTMYCFETKMVELCKDFLSRNYKTFELSIRMSVVF